MSPSEHFDLYKNIYTMSHGLYHEARRRAALPQPVIKHQKPASLLLSAPNNIVFELFSTIVREVPSERLIGFIANHLTDYLDYNWANKTTQRAVERLRREQTLDVRAGLEGVPIIKLSSMVGSDSPKGQQQTNTSDSGKRSSRESSPKSPSSLTQLAQKSPPLDYNGNQRKLHKAGAIKQIYEHIMWRIKSDNVTQITSLLVKLALDDGYVRGKLKAELYEDVAGCFEEWRSKMLIKLYAFGNAPANDQKLIMSHTNQGDITKWVANFIDGSEKRQNPHLLRKLAGALRDRTRNCIYITSDIRDALSSVQSSDAIRCAFVVDRLNAYESLQSLPISLSNPDLELLMQKGRLYLMSSLRCVQFAPDPTSDNCC